MFHKITFFLYLYTLRLFYVSQIFSIYLFEKITRILIFDVMILINNIKAKRHTHNIYTRGYEVENSLLNKQKKACQLVNGTISSPAVIENYLVIT